jgi:hypothetical protein
MQCELNPATTKLSNRVLPESQTAALARADSVGELVLCLWREAQALLPVG